MPKTIVVAVAVTAVVFLALDGIWLGFVSRGLYQREIGSLLLESPRLGVAAAFYLLYIIGLVYFCVMPGVAEQSVLRGLVNGAFFGVVAYATYDLTNLATLKGWSEMLVFIDIAWGCFASALASAAGAGAAVRVAATG